jgi:hypothetical protein
MPQALKFSVEHAKGENKPKGGLTEQWQWPNTTRALVVKEGGILTLQIPINITTCFAVCF